MKLICQRKTFAEALGVVSGVIPSKHPKEILQNAKLECGSGNLGVALSGTDLEVGVRYTIGGDDQQWVKKPGAVLLPAGRALQVIREMTCEQITLELVGSNLCLRGDRAEYKFPTHASPDEFPAVEPFNASEFHSISAAVLRLMLRQTVFACDVESTRYALGGVLFDLKGGELTLAATDTRRLAVSPGACSAGSGEIPKDHKPVVPSKALSLLMKTLDVPGDIDFTLGVNDAHFRIGDVSIRARLVEGRFPRYQDVIPKDSPVEIHLTAGPVLTAVKQAQVVTNEESRGVDFEFAAGLLTLKSRAAEIGESKIELPIAYEGSPLTITLDPRYLVDFLRTLDAGQGFRLNMTDGESAALCSVDESYRYVVMPLSRDR